VKQNSTRIRDLYCSEVRAWNRVHSLISTNKSPAVLFEECLLAFSSFYKDSKDFKYTQIIDIGSGSGVLGFAWLSLDPSHRCMFIEPILKKSSFILNLCTKIGISPKRYSVISEKIENIKNTIDDENIFCASRAFSGSKSLEEAVGESVFYDLPLYTFHKNKEEEFSFKKIEINKLIK